MICNCALPALTNGTECCKNCLNNPENKFNISKSVNYIKTNFFEPVSSSGVIPIVDDTKLYLSNPPKLAYKCGNCYKSIGFKREFASCPYCRKKINWEYIDWLNRSETILSVDLAQGKDFTYGNTSNDE